MEKIEGKLWKEEEGYHWKNWDGSYQNRSVASLFLNAIPG
jgi:hypothetical protein